jgi:hypothetical protein
MLPTLPLDVAGKQIREGDTVVYGNDNGSYLNVSKVWKITPHFVWMKKKTTDKHSARREFRRVAIIEGK